MKLLGTPQAKADYNSGIYFNTTNPNLNIGQSMAVNIYSVNNYYQNNFYISQNTNSNAVSANIVGSQLNLYGLSNGTSTITVYQNNTGQFGTLYVTVGSGYNYNYGNNYYGSLTFSNSNPTLAQNQSASVTVYSSYGYSNYYSNNFYAGNYSNSGIASVSVIGNTVNIYGQTPGRTSVTIYQNGTNLSGILNILVTGSNGNNYGYYPGNLVQYPGSVLGTSLYPNGTLIKEGNTISITYKNTKSGFSNYNAFKGMGFSLNSVIDVGSSSLLDSGHVINTANRAHPWGTWIKYQGTVYCIDAQGLIPISDYSIFLNNGGSDALVVPANRYDLGLNVLGLMTMNDPRMH